MLSQLGAVEAALPPPAGPQEFIKQGPAATAHFQDPQLQAGSVPAALSCYGPGCCSETLDGSHGLQSHSKTHLPLRKTFDFPASVYIAITKQAPCAEAQDPSPVLSTPQSLGHIHEASLTSQLALESVA